MMGIVMSLVGPPNTQDSQVGIYGGDLGESVIYQRLLTIEEPFGDFYSVCGGWDTSGLAVFGCCEKRTYVACSDCNRVTWSIDCNQMLTYLLTVIAPLYIYD
jgi:hypothetical protein